MPRTKQGLTNDARPFLKDSMGLRLPLSQSRQSANPDASHGLSRFARTCAPKPHKGAQPLANCPRAWMANTRRFTLGRSGPGETGRPLWSGENPTAERAGGAGAIRGSQLALGLFQDAQQTDGETGRTIGRGTSVVQLNREIRPVSPRGMRPVIEDHRPRSCGSRQNMRPVVLPCTSGAVASRGTVLRRGRLQRDSDLSPTGNKN